MSEDTPDSEVTIEVTTPEQAKAIAEIVSTPGFRKQVNDLLDTKWPDSEKMDQYTAPVSVSGLDEEMTNQSLTVSYVNR